MNSKLGLFRSARIAVMGIGLAILLGMVGSMALARSQTVTLTLSKVTNPTGGQDFPVTAVGSQPSLLTAFKSPRDIEQDQSGVLYIVGYLSSRVLEMDRDGNKIRSWGKKGTGPGEMLLPQDLSLYEDGNGLVVYVADSSNHRIQYFTMKGQLLGAIGSQGTGDGQFNRPEGIVVAPDRTLFVADTYNQRIQVFSPTGDFVRTWGEMGSGPGQFSYPTSVALGAGGELYVADSNNNRIQVFTAEGQFLRQWGSAGSQPGQFNTLTHVHAAENGFIYVSDTYNHRVQKFMPDGRFIAAWGIEGPGDNEFERPKGLVTDETTGLLYVVDIDNSRVDVYAETTVFLDDGQQEAVELPASTYEVTEAVESPWSLSEVTCEGAQAQPIDRGVQIQLTDAASCTFMNQAPIDTGGIDAFVYEDVDMSGSYGAGDMPLQGWTVLVRDGAGSQVGNAESTDVNGAATFAGLLAGDYHVCQVLPPGWVNSEPGNGGQPIIGSGQEVCRDATVTAGSSVMAAFGNYEAPRPTGHDVYLPVIMR